MRAMPEVFPGITGRQVNYAENQDEYLTLPSLVSPSGTVFTRWELTWKERLAVLLGGSIFLQVMTFNRPLQPVKLTVDPPVEDFLAS